MAQLCLPFQFKLTSAHPPPRQQGMLYIHGLRPPVAPVGLSTSSLLVNKNWGVKVRSGRLVFAAYAF